MDQLPLHLSRLRQSKNIRRLLAEHIFTVDDIIYPLFVRPGNGIRKEISSMPGIYQFSIDTLVEEVKEVEVLGIPAIILFGIPEYKDEKGSSSWQEDGIVQQAIRAIKQSGSKLVIIADVCFCEYTSHGHCGMLDKNNLINHDATTINLKKQTHSLAQAGADILAPSGMIDGMVNSMRTTLDNNNFHHVLIMSYAAKFASSLYSPFRDAAEGAPQFGDRQTYQLPIANSREALSEIACDTNEGADIIIIKPALSYLDIVSKAKKQCNLPLATYMVSGEYAMVKAAVVKGWIDEENIVKEFILSCKRAGASMIITYWAKQLAQWFSK